MWFKRTLVSVLSALCLFAGLGITVSAETVPTMATVSGISPLYEIANKAYSVLNIVGTDAVCTSSASGYNTSKITVEQSLEKRSGWFIFQSWSTVDGASWTESVNESSIRLSSTRSGLDSGTYRVKSVFTLTDKQGETETITVYSDSRSV